MTGETDETGGPDEPIDADFEPAPPTADYVMQVEDKGRGPGWIALGVTGVCAALFGGVIAAGFDQIGGGGYAPETLVGEVLDISENQTHSETRLAELATELRNTEARLAREISGTAAGAGDAEALDALTGEIETLNERLDALQMGEADAEGIAAIVERLDTLERADEQDVTSPRLANRAITALRSRVDGIQDAQEQIANRQAIRAEALADLLARIDVIEASLSAGGDETEVTDTLAAMRADIDALKAAIEDGATPSEETERLNRWVEELRAKEAEADVSRLQSEARSKAMLALLTVEAAARQGRSFQSAHAQLADALPDNQAVADLAPLAADGVPTLAVLQAQFDTAALAAISAAETVAAGDEADGWGWVRNVFGDGIEVRRSGDAGTSIETDIANAEEALDAQDLVAAIGHIENLEEPAAEAFAGWLRDANARVRLEGSLDTLRLNLLGAER